MELELIVRLRGQYESFGACIEIPELYRKEFEKIDVCTYAAIAPLVGGVTKEVGKIVMKTREDAADVLAKYVSEMLVNEMKKNDTVDGD